MLDVILQYTLDVKNDNFKINNDHFIINLLVVKYLEMSEMIAELRLLELRVARHIVPGQLL